MYGQGQGRQAVAVAFVASPKKPALHLLHCGPSVLCWQFRQWPYTGSQELACPLQLQPEQVPR